MFDGGVNYANGEVNLTSKSKNLIEGINKLLIELKLHPDYISPKPDKFDRHRLIIRKNEKLKDCLSLFEKNTEKWYRLHERLYGLKKFKNTQSELIKEFQHHYRNKRKNALSFAKILKSMPSKSEFDISFLENRIRRNASTIRSYVYKMEKWDIITSVWRSGRKVYKLNERLPTIRRKIYD